MNWKGCRRTRSWFLEATIYKLQTGLNRLGEWAVENEKKINPG